jgi:hypothetical protein
VPRLLSVMSMAAPLLLLGCSSKPVMHRQFLGLAAPPVPLALVFGSRAPSQPAYDKSGSAVPSLAAPLDARSLSALHATLPVPSLVEITNLDNECSIIIRIVGRGAMAYDRIIEISPASAKLLRITGRGDVRVKYLEPAPMDGRDVIERTHLARYPGLGCTR